jgi:transcriptional regulator with XRE-family HTH domain
MITSQQMRAARALLGIDQRQLAELAKLSLPTIQRMEASDGQVRGVVDTLVKVISALESSGIELIGENAPSVGVGRGVRLRKHLGGAHPNACRRCSSTRSTRRWAMAMPHDAPWTADKRLLSTHSDVQYLADRLWVGVAALATVRNHRRGGSASSLRTAGPI